MNILKYAVFNINKTFFSISRSFMKIFKLDGNLLRKINACLEYQDEVLFLKDLAQLLQICSHGMWKGFPQGSATGGGANFYENNRHIVLEQEAIVLYCYIVIYIVILPFCFEGGGSDVSKFSDSRKRPLLKLFFAIRYILC